MIPIQMSMMVIPAQIARDSTIAVTRERAEGR
jgi:hypothetical protein